ncbi:equilibrative nucleoside transporter-like protein 1 [Dinothrombium tinctorium]|uniref:Equilibrative nucleoside transporter-like protein 1 n=1 Tax=Dinothrombium tinctorium TaxID=1965070 RepID=A0A443RNB2_9ACAR|nr:equilibrative nucleoside transporter-like protein 1 [Dinothrombium tinctorium]
MPDTRTLPVLFDADYIYIVAGIIFALTNGYLGGLAMMYAPKSVESEFSSISAMMASISIILGILAGVNFSFIFPSLVKL